MLIVRIHHYLTDIQDRGGIIYNMAVNQIYRIINSVVSQNLGSTGLTQINTEQGLISLGNAVLSSSTTTNDFINSLVDLIGKDIFSFRKYNSKFKDLMRDNFEYGLVARKIKVSMPEVEADQSYDLQDGSSVDMYKIAKPKATQKLFESKTPWQIRVTISRHQLKNAFKNEGNMDAFLSLVYGEVQNEIEVVIDGMGRNCLANFIAEVSDKPKRGINVLDMYNKIFTTETLKAANCMYSPKFLRFLSSTINKYTKRMTDMSVNFNDGTETRFTPIDKQKLFILTDWQQEIESSLLANDFHDSYNKLKGFNEVSYWQSSETPDSIDVKRASDDTPKKISGVIACLGDIEALGTFKEDEWTATTPMNAAGGYYNTYWHFNKLWFNDLSENFVMFYVADPEAA